MPANVIAQYISPADFENLRYASGIIIQHGVTAVVCIDGREVAQINGGTYDFVDQDEIDKFLERKVYGGIRQDIIDRCKSFIRFFTGKKLREQIEETDDARHPVSEIKSMDDAVRFLKNDSAISVYLKCDVPFQVMFGTCVTPEGSIAFSPLPIRCRHLLADVAVTIRLRISNASEFIRNYLTATPTVTCTDIEAELTPLVKAILEECMGDCELTERGIPADVKAEIDRRLAAAIQLPGIDFVSTVEITASNEDFERLRRVADELYLSEKELDFARRTNEFRNRLAGVENEKKIAEASAAVDLHKALSEIDKDMLLSEDEIDEFYMLLSRQKKLRDARNEQEIDAALNDIARNRLLNEEEMAALRSEIANRSAGRESISLIMQMQHMADTEAKRIEVDRLLLARQYEYDTERTKNEIELDRLRRSHAYDTRIEDAELDLEVTRRELGKNRIVDEYCDERFARDVEKARATQELEIDYLKKHDELEAAKAEREDAADRAFFEQCLAMSKAKNEHELMLEQEETEKLRIKTNMTAEQLLAEQAASLDAAAQAALAAGIGSTAKAETESRFREEQLRMARAEADRVERLMRENLNMLAGVTQTAIGGKAEAERQRYADQQQLASEYRTQMQHEQERYDKTNAHVMGHETDLYRSSVDAIRAVSGAPRQTVGQEVYVVCPECHRRVLSQKFCNVCGAEINIAK